MKKRLFAVIPLILILIFIAFPRETRATQDGWVKEYGSWYYYENGSALTGWQKIGKVWYYFEEYGGYMYSDGIYEINGKYYYFARSGEMKTGWIKESYDYGTYWYYANSSGVLQTGWLTQNGVKYYLSDWFDMYSFGVYEIDGKSYYFDRSGAMRTGWIKETYDYGSGPMYEWYYADSKGVLQSGWMKSGGKWYYFDPEYYMMYKCDSYRISNKIYVFEKGGALVSTEGWKQIQGYWYYTNADGTAQTGWKHDGYAWTYLNRLYGHAVTGGYVIDNKLYMFDENAHLTDTITTPGWYQDYEGYWYYVKSNGKGATGWEKIGGKWYYFESSGYMVSYDWWDIDGQVYFFKSNGQLVSKEGWYKDSLNEWYYVASNGLVYTGWKKINKKWYYFDEYSGQMYHDTTAWIDDQDYTFDSNGVWIG